MNTCKLTMENQGWPRMGEWHWSIMAHNFEVAFRDGQSLDSNSCTIHHIEMLQELVLQKEWNIEMIWGQEQGQGQHLQEQNCFRPWFHCRHNINAMINHVICLSQERAIEQDEQACLISSICRWKVAVRTSTLNNSACPALSRWSQMISITTMTIAHPNRKPKGNIDQNTFLPAT